MAKSTVTATTTIRNVFAKNMKIKTMTKATTKKNGFKNPRTVDKYTIISITMHLICVYIYNILDFGLLFFFFISHSSFSSSSADSLAELTKRKNKREKTAIQSAYLRIISI